MEKNRGTDSPGIGVASAARSPFRTVKTGGKRVAAAITLLETARDYATTPQPDIEQAKRYVGGVRKFLESIVTDRKIDLRIRNAGIDPGPAYEPVRVALASVKFVDGLFKSEDLRIKFKEMWNERIFDVKRARQHLMMLAGDIVIEYLPVGTYELNDSSGRLVGCLEVSTWHYKITDLQGKQLAIEEIPLEHPLIDPVDIFAALLTGFVYAPLRAAVTQLFRQGVRLGPRVLMRLTVAVKELPAVTPELAARSSITADALAAGAETRAGVEVGERVVGVSSEAISQQSTRATASRLGGSVARGGAAGEGIPQAVARGTEARLASAAAAAPVPAQPSSTPPLRPQRGPRGQETSSAILFRFRDEAVAAAQKLVSQDVQASGSLSRLEAKVGINADAFLKARVRQAVADGTLPSTIRVSPTVTINPNNPTVRLPQVDIWDSATGKAWDLTTAKEAEILKHQHYVGMTMPDGTVITELHFLLYHAIPK
ncbi:MAG: hypothetical protein M3P26_17715 [Gemmatimonadota bacterium]|nr:hypothetical protein [Gemmatimonadota bacterium]